MAVFSAPQPGFFLMPLPDDGRRMTGSREELEEEALQECAEDPGAAVTRGDQSVAVNAFALCQAVCANKVLSWWEGEALRCLADDEPAVKRLHSFLLCEELCKL